MKLKEIGIIGLVGYILSLPIMFWKSSKAGKVVSVFLLLSIFLWFAPKLSDIYFLKFKWRLETDNKLMAINKDIESLEDYLKTTRESLDSQIIEVNKSFEDINKQYREGLRESYVNYNEELGNAWLALNLIKEKEREGYRKKISELYAAALAYRLDQKPTKEEIEVADGLVEHFKILSEKEQKDKQVKLDVIKEKILDIKEKKKEIQRNAYQRFGVVSADTWYIRSDEE